MLVQPVEWPVLTPGEDLLKMSEIGGWITGWADLLKAAKAATKAQVGVGIREIGNGERRIQIGVGVRRPRSHRCRHRPSVDNMTIKEVHRLAALCRGNGIRSIGMRCSAVKGICPTTFAAIHAGVKGVKVDGTEREGSVEI
jgi:hypothetical protein